MLILRHDDVASTLTMEMAIDAMRGVYFLQSQGLTDTPQRLDAPAGDGWLRLMPVAIAGLKAFGFKAMNLTPRVGVRYAIWVYDLTTGELRGILDARLITAMRTAASTAVATDLMARKDVGRLAVIGTGAEARHHLAAMRLVRPSPRVTVYSRSSANRAAFIADMADPRIDELVECSSVDAAVADADLVVLATKSPTPMLSAAHLRAGMHVNSVGSARSDQFELTADAFARFDSIVCDSATQVFSEAGDAIEARRTDETVFASAGELSEAVAGRMPGRRREDDITLYKSVGLAIQDVALAHAVLLRAEAAGIGTETGDFLSIKAAGR
jgi:ornithine cyclodeaminase/alanine dehydrogenase-like protein (mu-crystallin family)